MKKRILSFLLLLGVGWCGAFATHQLVVEKTDGSAVKYVLADEPVVTFSGTKVCIKSTKAEASYERSAVSRYYFETISDGIAEVTTSPTDLRFDYSNADKVTIHGITDVASVKVYDVTGKQMPVLITSSAEAVSVNISSLSSGVYVIALPNHPSIKIKK